MRNKKNSFFNKTNPLFLIGILLFIVVVYLVLFFVRSQRQAGQYLQEPVELTSADCKVRFDTSTQNLCRNDAGSLVIKGTVIEAPSGARLQTSWFQVEPVRTSRQTASFSITSLPYSFSITASWPGTRDNKSVKIRALADLYDADGKKLPHCSASNATYWYPYLECGAILKTPTN